MENSFAFSDYYNSLILKQDFHIIPFFKYKNRSM